MTGSITYDNAKGHEACFDNILLAPKFISPLGQNNKGNQTNGIHGIIFEQSRQKVLERNNQVEGRLLSMRCSNCNQTSQMKTRHKMEAHSHEQALSGS